MILPCKVPNYCDPNDNILTFSEIYKYHDQKSLFSDQTIE